MIDIVVDTLALHRSNRGSITGPLFVRVEGTAFPEEGWSDFPVVVLGWWLAAVDRLLQGKSEVEELDFMDGPHVLLARRGAGDLIHIACCTNRGERHVVHEAVVAAGAIKERLAEAARQVSQACEQRSWPAPDLTAQKF